MVELGKLGTVTDSDGNSVYLPTKNPLLQQGVLGMNPGPGGYGATRMNPSAFATGPAASALAKALGGTVVTDPQSAPWNVTARVLAVQLPDHDPVNAGYICSVLGNDCAYGVRAKSWDICEQLGIPFDPKLAEELIEAVMAE